MSARAAAPATVYLVDASPYIFRAHFSLPSSLKDPHSRRLATLADDAPLRADLARLAYRGADLNAAGALFEPLGFKHLGDRLPPAAQARSAGLARAAQLARRGRRCAARRCHA